MLRRAHPGLRETSKVLRILGEQEDIIRNFISDSDVVVRELERNKSELARWIRETGETAEVSAAHDEALAAGWRRLPTFLAEMGPTMARLEELTDAQTPLLEDLRRASPALTELFTRLGPFSEASRPAFRSLGEASRAGGRRTSGGTGAAASRRLARWRPGGAARRSPRRSPGPP